MKKAIQSGDTVSVHYTGKLENGEVFDSSSGRRPLTFTVGCGQIIRGFDEAVVGMTAGEKKTVTIAPEMAYGPRQAELIVDIPKNTVPEDMELEKGMMIELIDPQGNKIGTVGQVYLNDPTGQPDWITVNPWAARFAK